MAAALDSSDLDRAGRDRTIADVQIADFWIVRRTGVEIAVAHIEGRRQIRR